MTKRPAELDLTEEEGSQKKLKEMFAGAPGCQLEVKIHPIMEGINISNIVNYCDEDLAKKNYSDVSILSSDGHVLRYHRCMMVKYKVFEDMISNTIHEGKECELEFKLFNAQTINLALNYITDPNHLSDDNMRSWLSTTWTDLYELANWANIDALLTRCRWVMEHLTAIKNTIINCYTKHKLGLNNLFGAIMSGRSAVNEKLPTDFLSQCFNHAMNTNQIGAIIKHLLKIYCPTNEQMSLFFVKQPTRVNSWDNLEHVPFVGMFMDGIVPREIMKEFCINYVGKKDNPEGIDKFIHKLAELCISC